MASPFRGAGKGRFPSVGEVADDDLRIRLASLEDYIERRRDSAGWIGGPALVGFLVTIYSVYPTFAQAGGWEKMSTQSQSVVILLVVAVAYMTARLGIMMNQIFALRDLRLQYLARLESLQSAARTKEAASRDQLTRELIKALRRTN